VASYPVLGAFLTNMAHFYITHTIFNCAMAVAGSFPVYFGWNNGNQYNLTHDVIYTVRIFFEPPYAHGYVLDPSGNVLGYGAFNSASLVNVVGNYLYIETGDTHLKYHSVWARQKTNQSLSFQNFIGGLTQTPIGLSLPLPGAFSSLSVGTSLSGAPVTPTGVFYVEDDAAQGYPNPTIVHANGLASVEVKAKTLGYGSQVKLTNGFGDSATIGWDGNYAFNVKNSYGTVILGKPNGDALYTDLGLRIGGSAGPTWTSGTGAPSADAPIGSLYSRTDGGAATSLYVKTAAGAGAGNWTSK
jgi:hypothetical protein